MNTLRDPLRPPHGPCGSASQADARSEVCTDPQSQPRSNPGQPHPSHPRRQPRFVDQVCPQLRTWLIGSCALALCGMFAAMVSEAVAQQSDSSPTPSTASQPQRTSTRDGTVRDPSANPAGNSSSSNRNGTTTTGGLGSTSRTGTNNGSDIGNGIGSEVNGRSSDVERAKTGTVRNAFSPAGSFRAPQSGMEPGQLLPIRRIDVPAHRPEDWPRFDRPLVVVSRSEFEDLLRQSQPSAATPGPASWMQAQFTGRWSGGMFFEGQLTAQVTSAATQPVWLALPGWSMALADLKWGDRPAVWGTDSQGVVWLLVERPSDTLAGSWTAIGHAIGPYWNHQLQVPAALSSSMVLHLPVEWELTSSSGLLQVVSDAALVEAKPSTTPAAPVPLASTASSATAPPQNASTAPAMTQAAGEHTYRLELGSDSNIQLNIRPRSQVETGSLLLYSQQLSTSVREDQIRFQATLDLDILGTERQQVLLRLPRGLEVFSINLGVDDQISWDQLVDPQSQQETLRVQLPRPWVGKLSGLRIEGILAQRLGGTASIPQVEVIDGLFQTGQQTIEVVRPLQLMNARSTGLRQIAPLAPIADGETLSFRQFQPQALLTLEVRRPRPALSALMASQFQLMDDLWSQHTEVQLTCSSGSVFRMGFRLPVEWDVTDVATIPVQGQSEEVSWDVVEDLSSGRTLNVEFLSAITTTRPKLLRINTQRRMAQSPERFELPLLRPQEGVATSAVVQLVAGGRQRPAVVQPSEFRVVVPRQLPASWTSMPSVQEWMKPSENESLWLQSDTVDRLCQVWLEPGELPIAGHVHLIATATSEQLTERGEITFVRPPGDVTSRWLVALPRAGMTPRWTVREPANAALQVTELFPEQLSAWHLPSSVTLWELRLSSTASDQVRLSYERTAAAEPTARIGLPILPQASPFRGVVTATAAPDAAVQFVAFGLSPEPIAPRRAGLTTESAVVGTDAAAATKVAAQSRIATQTNQTNPGTTPALTTNPLSQAGPAASGPTPASAPTVAGSQEEPAVPSPATAPGSSATSVAPVTPGTPTSSNTSSVPTLSAAAIDTSRSKSASMRSEPTDSDTSANIVPAEPQSWSYRPGEGDLVLMARALMPAKSTATVQVRVQSLLSGRSSNADYHHVRIQGRGHHQPLNLTLPKTAELLTARLDDIDVTWSRSAQFSIPAHAADQSWIFELTYRVMHGEGWLADRMTVPLPTLTGAETIGFFWTCAVPPNFEFCSEPVGVKLIRPLELPTWTQRLFGPLGRGQRDAMLLPWRPETWSSSPAVPSTAALTSPTLDQLFSPPAEWRVYDAIAGQLPADLRLVVWRSDHLRGLSWLLVLLTLCIGLAVRLSDWAHRDRLSVGWLMLLGTVTWVLPHPWTLMTGAAIAGSLLALLAPRRWITRPPSAARSVEVPTGSTRSFALPQPMTSWLIAVGVTGALASDSLTAVLAQSPARSGSASGVSPTQAPFSPPGSFGSDNRNRIGPHNAIAENDGRADPRFSSPNGVSAPATGEAFGTQPATRNDQRDEAVLSAENLVLVPIDAPGQPSEKVPLVYTTEELLQQLRQRARLVMTVPDFLYRQAGYTWRLGADGRATLQADWDVWLIGAGNRRLIPLGLTGSTLAGASNTSALVDGLPSPLQRDPLAGGFEVLVEPSAQPVSALGFPALSSHRITVQVRKTIEQRDRQSRFFVTIPAVHQAESTWQGLSRPQDRLQLSALGAIDPTDRDGILRAQLGPTSTLEARWGNAMSQSTEEITLDLAEHVELNDTTAIGHSLAVLRPATGSLDYVHVALPPQAQIIRAESAGVTAISLEESSPQQTLYRLDFSPPLADRSVVRVDFVAPIAIQQDELRWTGLRWLLPSRWRFTAQRYLGLEVPNDVVVTPQWSDEIRELPRTGTWPHPEFASVFGSSTDVLAIAGLNSQAVIRRTMLSPRRKLLRWDQSAQIDRRVLRWEMTADIELSGAPVHHHTLLVDRRLQIDSLSVKEQGAERLLRWTESRLTGSTEQSRFTLFLSDPMVDVQQITLRGSFLVPISGELVLPSARVEEADGVRGNLRVEFAEGLDAIWRSSKGLHTSDAAQSEAMAPEPAAQSRVAARYEVQEPDWRGVMTLQNQVLKRVIEGVVYVTDLGEGAVELKCRYRWPAADSFDTAVCRLPAEWSNASQMASESAVISTQRLESGETALLVRGHPGRSVLSFQATAVLPRKELQTAGLPIPRWEAPHSDSVLLWMAVEGPESQTWLADNGAGVPPGWATELLSGLEPTQQSSVRWHRVDPLATAWPLTDRALTGSTDSDACQHLVWSTGSRKLRGLSVAYRTALRSDWSWNWPADLALVAAFADGEPARWENNNGRSRLTRFDHQPFREATLVWQRGANRLGELVTSSTMALPEPATPTPSGMLVTYLPPEDWWYRSRSPAITTDWVDAALMMLETRGDWLNRISQSSPLSGVPAARAIQFHEVFSMIEQKLARQPAPFAGRNASRGERWNNIVAAMQGETSSQGVSSEPLLLPAYEQYRWSMIDHPRAVHLTLPAGEATVRWWAADVASLKWLGVMALAIVAGPLLRLCVRVEWGPWLSLHSYVPLALLGFVWWLCLVPSIAGLALMAWSAARAWREAATSRAAPTSGSESTMLQSTSAPSR
jgi:hypothetical protein